MSGKTVVPNGKAFESKIFAILNEIPGVNVIKDIPYPSIYSAYAKKHKQKMEFRAENIFLTYDTLNSQGNKITKTRNFKAVNIECKYQEDSGTTDEKYPLLYENSLISDADATLFVYQDPLNNIKRGALEFMHDKALNSEERLIVMDFDSFLACVNQQYTLSLSSDVLKQGSELFQFYYPRMRGLESRSKERFNAAITKNCHCIEQFDKYFDCQRKFHHFTVKHGVQSLEHMPYLDDLRALRKEIIACLPK